jgi:dipeptidyl aminopeptidase/acylaminoacyl peptidase
MSRPIIRFLLAPALACTFSLAASFGAPRSLELEDLFRMKRVSDPQVSPDGKWIAYVVTVVNKAENSSNSDIWVVSPDGRNPRQLTRRSTTAIRVGRPMENVSRLNRTAAVRSRSTRFPWTAAKRRR